MPGETPRCHPWPLISASWPPGCSAGETGSQQHRKQSRPHACPPPSMQQDGAGTASTGQQRSQAGTTTVVLPSVLAPAERDTPTTGPGTKLRGLGAHKQSAALLGLITGTHTHTHPEAARALGCMCPGQQGQLWAKASECLSAQRSTREKSVHTSALLQETSNRTGTYFISSFARCFLLQRLQAWALHFTESLLAENLVIKQNEQPPTAQPSSV